MKNLGISCFFHPNFANSLIFTIGNKVFMILGVFFSFFFIPNFLGLELARPDPQTSLSASCQPASQSVNQSDGQSTKVSQSANQLANQTAASQSSSQSARQSGAVKQPISLPGSHCIIP
jgi:hypothetical protein